MIIALDFDNTFTILPNTFVKFIKDIKYNKGQVFIVTARQRVDTHPWLTALILSELVDGVIFCDGQAKEEICANLGIYPSIWIDDSPLNITVSRAAGEDWEGYPEWREWDLNQQLSLPFVEF